jgi:hypothetical protein
MMPATKPAASTACLPESTRSPARQRAEKAQPHAVLPGKWAIFRGLLAIFILI